LIKKKYVKKKLNGQTYIFLQSKGLFFGVWRRLERGIDHLLWDVKLEK